MTWKGTISWTLPYVDEAIKRDITIQSYYDKSSDSSGDSDIDDIDAKMREPAETKFDRAPKLNVIVGFIRLTNYVCASIVLFGLFVSLFYPKLDSEPDHSSDYDLWQDVVFISTGWIQIFYLLTVSILILIDSVATKDFPMERIRGKSPIPKLMPLQSSSFYVHPDGCSDSFVALSWPLRCH